MRGFSRIRWTIRTPSGEYRPRASIFEPRHDRDEAKKAERVWFFGRHAVRNLDAEAVRGAIELYEALSPLPFSRSASQIDARLVEHLVRSLDFAVFSGRIRFDEIEKIQFAASSRQDQPEERAAAAVQPTDFIEVVLVDDSGAPVTNAQYEIRLPDGRVINGRTDAQGKAWAPPTPTGSCEVSFPKLGAGT